MTDRSSSFFLNEEFIISTYDLDVRAGSDARGNVGGDTLPLPVVLLS